MLTQRSVKQLTVVMGLAALAGVAFLIGQLSAPSPVSAQGQACVAVAATHTGRWRSSEAIWEADRPAVVTVTTPPGSATLTVDGRRISLMGGSGATVIGRKIHISSADEAGGTYMITTTVPCQ